MTRDQMIAWLTLEGWEPGYTSNFGPEIHREGDAVYRAHMDAEGVLYDRSAALNGEYDSISWSSIMTAELTLMYERTIELFYGDTGIVR